jgi:hypothetical protein
MLGSGGIVPSPGLAGGGCLHRLDELRRDVVDDVLARRFREDRDRAGHAAERCVEPDHQILEADALAVARAHANERERGLIAKRPRVLVMADDRVELFGAVFGRLPPVHVRVADRASRGAERAGCQHPSRYEGTRHDLACACAPTPCPEPLSHRLFRLLRRPRRRLRIASRSGSRCYAYRTVDRNCFGKLTPFAGMP